MGAVLHAPEMLILDEPTSGVDAAIRDSFWGLLISLSREDGVTIVIPPDFGRDLLAAGRPEVAL